MGCVYVALGVGWLCLEIRFGSYGRFTRFVRVYIFFLTFLCDLIYGFGWGACA